MTLFIHFSPAMQRVHEVVAHVASSDVPVLISGGPGTGKARIAEEIHARGGRPGRVETFSGLILSGGRFDPEPFQRRPPRSTVYFPAIDALDPATRVKLLHVFELQRAHGVRVIVSAASSKRLPDFDASAVRIELPLLRDRRKDVIPLAGAILARASHESGRPPFVVECAAAAALEAYAWPGNVRELESVLLRAVALTSGSEIDCNALPPEVAHASRLRSIPSDLASLRYRDVLACSRDLLSREYFAAILESEHGNVKQAAERAGIERESLHRLLKRYGLRAETFRARG